MDKLKKPPEVAFKFDSRFSQLIGRNLISNPVIAVIELVKNAYDADAQNVIIEFSGLKTSSPSLRIKDDGEGMSMDDIINKWMVVGTDNKVRKSYSNTGRRKVGEKGIGRFAVERLAQKTTIISTCKGSADMITLAIDWCRYENSEELFTDINIG